MTPTTIAKGVATKPTNPVGIAVTSAKVVKGAANQTVKATEKVGDALSGKGTISGLGLAVVATGGLMVYLAVTGETLTSWWESILRPTNTRVIRHWDGTTTTMTGKARVDPGSPLGGGSGAVESTPPAGIYTASGGSGQASRRTLTSPAPATTPVVVTPVVAPATPARYTTTRFDSARGSLF